MASDYDAIREDNKRRYGTDIADIGHMLLADRYDDRTHFMFELLQNAEDALSRRTSWKGTKSVTFSLKKRELRVSHFGEPFNQADVTGICGIAKSTKRLTAIGRFGIGFKSVFAFTNRPEIHSGQEDFAIESYVWPTVVSTIARDPNETVILLPLKASDKLELGEIEAGLGRLGAPALLFLRHINEIHWAVEGGRSGHYLRESTEIDAGVRRVTVIGQERGKAEVDEVWLVFSQPVIADGSALAGHVEIAFSSRKVDSAAREDLQRLEHSPLVVFFPTVLETHLGFLVQGPYRTTPSRDNVPRNDPWNQRIVGDTATLLIRALIWLRDHDRLDTAALRCLPLDAAKFDDTSMFAPLFEMTKRAMSSEALLPRFDTGHLAAARARIARTQEIRELFTSAQLMQLFGQERELAWLSGDITPDRTPELHEYLTRELGIAEITPETIVQTLTKEFLEAQSDQWIVRLYDFLSGQSALLRLGRLHVVPLVRLDDGSHVTPKRNGQAQAFLPGEVATDFPTVRVAVCPSGARAFLQSLGLTEPDPVDDVVRNVLPKYHRGGAVINDKEYDADIGRILTAFATDSKVKRDGLINALKRTAFVMAIDAGDGSKLVSKPGELYPATERLRDLFTGVSDVLLIDDSYACLRGDKVAGMLENCGANPYLRPVADTSISGQELSELRVKAGHAQTSHYSDLIKDSMLAGLHDVLKLLPQLTGEQRTARAKLLWEELTHLEEGRGKGVFTGEYTWTHHGHYRATFDAAFVRHLNVTEWVPDAKGELQLPEFVLFDALRWKPDPFLQSKIRFKSPIIETLAREAGIEPGVLDLLKKFGVTSEAELRKRLGLRDEQAENEAGSKEKVDGAIKGLLGEAPIPTPPVPDPAGAEPSGSGSGGSGAGTGTRAKDGGGRGIGAGDGGGPGKRVGSAGGKRTPATGGGRPFISYVGAHPGEAESDPDGLDQTARLALEEEAISFIEKSESKWKRTDKNNPGFDLFEAAVDGSATRWCEVKAMTGGLHDRAVGLSHTQFAYAHEHGEAYWLYVVENAGTDKARIVRIQDPAGKARTFTFDHGWLAVSEMDAV
ncbi:MAG: DUF3883 domain-containing protein [Acidimicrobiia bacterium]|nr:DUF3883 domain-containing protein [Acidimicrobiia bacterium]